MHRKILLVLIFSAILISGCPWPDVVCGDGVCEPMVESHPELPKYCPEDCGYEIIEVGIEELNQKLDSYVGQTVMVESYFGHKNYFGNTGMSYLITDYGLFLVDQPLPEYSYIRLDCDIPPKYDGKKLWIIGIVGTGNINFPLDLQDAVAVISVESYGVIE